VRGTPCLVASCCSCPSSFCPPPLLLLLVSPCRPARGNASKARCRIAKTLLVKNNIDKAEAMLQVGLYEDPEHTELNALQVSMDLLDLGHKTQRLYAHRLEKHTGLRALQVNMDLLDLGHTQLL